jgi:hypothetical protein
MEFMILRTFLKSHDSANIPPEMIHVSGHSDAYANNLCRGTRGLGTPETVQTTGWRTGFNTLSWRGYDIIRTPRH